MFVILQGFFLLFPAKQKKFLQTSEGEFIVEIVGVFFHPKLTILRLAIDECCIIDSF
jgi:hypothetical protein